ncbi:MAG: tetratricopeptide repeat protein [Candidatus Kapabacteria bacterium]|nr:tetratricopeptide repeat protein [Candidatus Kapabacteria bacterium]
MKKYFIIIVLLSNFLFSQQEKVYELINNANLKANSGKYEDAIKDLKMALKIDKNSFEVYQARGIIYAGMLKDNKLALTDFNQAIKLNPSNGELYILRGRVFTELNEYLNAYKDFKKAYKIKPKSGYDKYENEYIIYNINQSLKKSSPKAYELSEDAMKIIEAKYYDKSFKYLDSAIVLDSNYYLAYAYRGMAYQILNYFDKAIIDYNKALKLNEFTDLAMFGLGEIYNLNEKYDLAIDIYSKLLQQKPKNHIAMRELGLTYYKSGNKIKAHEFWTNSLELGDKKVSSYIKKYPK